MHRAIAEMSLSNLYVRTLYRYGAPANNNRRCQCRFLSKGNFHCTGVSLDKKKHDTHGAQTSDGAAGVKPLHPLPDTDTRPYALPKRNQIINNLAHNWKDNYARFPKIDYLRDDLSRDNRKRYSNEPVHISTTAREKKRELLSRLNMSYVSSLQQQELQERDLLGLSPREKKEALIRSAQPRGTSQTGPAAAADGGVRRAQIKPVAQPEPDLRLRVALVGRQNVGKSSLWNALKFEAIGDPGAQRGLPRKQLVQDADGVTRDVIETVAELSGLYFTVLDTPGIALPESVGHRSAHNSGQILPPLLTEAAQRAVVTADVILYITSPTTPVDDIQISEVAALEREAPGVPIICVCNKADMVEHPSYDWAEFESLGLGTPVPVSAITKNGFEELADVLEPFVAAHLREQLSADWELEDAAVNGDESAMETIRERNASNERIRITFVGSPNAGKSTVVNRLLGYERSLTSASIMTTRDAIETPCRYRGRRLTLIDTAGANPVKKRREHEFLRELHDVTTRAINRADVCVICFDATQGPPNKRALELANYCADNGRPVIFCGLKWDAVLDGPAVAEAIDFQMRKQIGFARQCICVVVSANNSFNLELLLDECLNVYDVWNKSFPAATLTRFWKRLAKTVNIPSKYARVHRVVQVKTRPPTFLVNLQTRNEFHLLKQVQTNLIRNSFAEEFGFKGVPIRLIQDVKVTRGDEIGRRGF